MERSRSCCSQTAADRRGAAAMAADRGRVGAQPPPCAGNRTSSESRRSATIRRPGDPSVPARYAPTEEAYTSAGTPASMTAWSSRSLPATLTRCVIDSVRPGWINPGKMNHSVGPAQQRNQIVGRDVPFRTACAQTCGLVHAALPRRSRSRRTRPPAPQARSCPTFRWRRTRQLAYRAHTPSRLWIPPARRFTRAIAVGYVSVRGGAPRSGRRRRTRPARDRSG